MEKRTLCMLVLLLFSCEISGMQINDEKGLIKNIREELQLGIGEHIIGMHISSIDKLALVRHTHDRNNDCENRLTCLNTQGPESAVEAQQELGGEVVVTKMTYGGNFLFGYKDGRVGFYMPLSGHIKKFAPRTHSSIVALANSIVIDGHDKKPCKVLASISKNCYFHCIADSQNNCRTILLTESLRNLDKRTDHIVTAADIAPSSTGCLVAFGVHYGGQSNYPARYHKAVLVYDLADDKIIVFKGHTAPVTSVTFLPDTTVCSAAHDGTIRLWDPRTKEKIYTIQAVKTPSLCVGLELNQFGYNAVGGFLKGGPLSVFSAIPSACGRFIASIDAKSKLLIWDVDSGACLHSLDLDMCGCQARTVKVAFAQDSSCLCVYNNSFQKLYDLRAFTEKLNGELSQEEKQNALQTFKRKLRYKKNESLFHILRKREYGQK